VLLWPLSRLPYLTAYAVWEALLVAASIGFILIWRPPTPPLTFVFSMMSLPLFASLANGQDTPILLLLIALTALFYRKERYFLAGLIFSLCSIKFHLFVLTPVLIIGQRAWRFGGGLLTGGAILAAISFAAAGLSWPVEFLHSVLTQRFSPGQSLMPSLHGLVTTLGYDAFAEVVLGLLVVGACWVIASRASFPWALAGTLVGGLLLSYHSYLPDATILLPACLLAVAKARLGALRILALLLLTPVASALLLYASWSGIYVCMEILFVGLMAVEAWKAGNSGSGRACLRDAAAGSPGRDGARA